MPDDPKTGPTPADAAERLIEMAERYADRKASPANVANAMVALRYLDQAAGFSGDPRVQANTKAVAGFIHERYLADLGAAMACYREALEMVPGDETLIEAVARLKAQIEARDAGTARG
jgi:hypothetical protein